MFANTYAFNQDLSNWNINEQANLNKMFDIVHESNMSKLCKNEYSEIKTNIKKYST